MITLTNIAFGYPGKAVIRDLSLCVGAGELVCLLGPSGCGKSTILDVVAGLRHPDAGHRCVDSPRLGYAFQQPRLLPWRTVRENLGIALSGWFDKAEAQKTTVTWLERFGLADALDTCPAELSGGMARRVNLARAFAVAPDILLLDEPFAFLDDVAVEDVRRAIREVNDSGTTVLLVSHRREAIEPLTSSIASIDTMPIHLKATFPPQLQVAIRD